MKASLPSMLLAIAVLAPTAAEAHGRRHSYAPPPARVVVTNQSGADVTITLSGLPSRMLPAWQTTEILAPAGQATFRATYVQFGADRVLESEQLSLYPERTARIVLEPEDVARTSVTNDSPYDAVLFIDGRPGPSFGPGATRIVTTHLGRTDLQLVAGQRTLGRTTMDMRAFAEGKWFVCLPKVGDLLVQNPLPIAIELVAQGSVRTVGAYGQTLYNDVPIGPFTVTARRLTDQVIDVTTTDIRPEATSMWRVDAPRTGFLQLDSDHFLAAEVRLDGRTVAKVAPHVHYQVEAAVGWHELQVRDDAGRMILQTWVEVEAFEDERVRFGTPGHQQAENCHERDDRDGYADRDERHERYDRDHEEVVADRRR